MGDWQPCCYTAALNPDSGFCGECGRSLFRCVAYEQCKSLVQPLGYCTVCVHPKLAVEKGAVLKAHVGEVLSIPFHLSNLSPAGRALQILAVFKDEQEARNEAVPLNWEKLDAGQTRAFSVDTTPMAHSGVHRLRLTVILASCSKGFEEHYAFTGEIVLQVEGRGAAKVIQNIEITNSNVGDNAMLVSKHQNLKSGQRQTQMLDDQLEVHLERAERYELENGYRGYAAKAYRVSRDTKFVFTGFPGADHPLNGPLTTPHPVLRCGRNSRRYDSQKNPQPNDLCLRAYNAESATLDIPTSQAISRHVCDFLIQNNRLYLKAQGDNCLLQNNDPLHSGELRLVNDADVFRLPPGHTGAFDITTRFTTASGVVEQIEFQRLPVVSA